MANLYVILCLCGRKVILTVMDTGTRIKCSDVLAFYSPSSPQLCIFAFYTCPTMVVESNIYDDDDDDCNATHLYGVYEITL